MKRHPSLAVFAEQRLASLLNLTATAPEPDEDLEHYGVLTERYVNRCNGPEAERRSINLGQWLTDTHARLAEYDPVLAANLIERVQLPEGGLNYEREFQERSSRAQSFLSSLAEEPLNKKRFPGKRPPSLYLERLHPAVLKASRNLFMDGHYAQAIFEAFKAVEVRVRELSGLELTGQNLMSKAFDDTAPKIRVAVEEGASGKSEQLGFKFLFMGAMAGIRNPKGHEFVEQKDPERTLEYLAFASLLLRRLDDAERRAPQPPATGPGSAPDLPGTGPV